MSKEEEINQVLDEVVEESKSELIVNLIKSAFERLVEESKWFTSIGLALLGFFTALLVQLKLAEIQPINFIAIVAIITLVISLGSGFWLKLCSMRDDIGEDLKPVIENLLVTPIKDKLNDFNSSDVGGTTVKDHETKGDSDSDQILESITNSLPYGLIIIQGSTLFISILAVFIYLMNFLL